MDPPFRLHRLSLGREESFSPHLLLHTDLAVIMADRTRLAGPNGIEALSGPLRRRVRRRARPKVRR
jgi:hypothetical protein